MKINFTKGLITYKTQNRILKNVKFYNRFKNPVNEVIGWSESFYNILKYWLLNLDSKEKKHLVNFSEATRYINILNKIEKGQECLL